ncbi:MAG: BON domain-containing protein, partial [Burkholderiaceae bacterium]|nr:BON domain-containing protein [Burkholderiaceae bacterium]
IINELSIGLPASLSSRSNDSLITAKVTASFLEARDIYANALKTVTEQGTVYLMGRVTKREGDRAATVARSVSGVKRVVKVFEYISEEELAGLTMQSASDSDGGATARRPGQNNPYRDNQEYR